MMIQVRCRCAQRTIDTETVGPWRLRCKTCQEIIYDPPATAAKPSVAPETTDDERSRFDEWLHGSSELQLLMSSDGKEGQPCSRHPDHKVIAACSRCEKLLCKQCLDRIGEAFTCGDCVEKQLLESRETERRGVLGFLGRIFGTKR